MEEIRIERRKSPWGWIVGLLLLLLLAWGVYQWIQRNGIVDTGAPAATATVPPIAEPIEPLPAGEAGNGLAPTPAPPTAADNAPIAVAAIVAGPAFFQGQPVVGTVQVVEVPDAGGFWVEQDGQRLYAAIIRSPDMQASVRPESVGPGRQVRLSGVVHDSARSSQLGADIDPAAREIIAGQRVFLLVDADNILAMDER